MEDCDLSGMPSLKTEFLRRVSVPPSRTKTRGKSMTKSRLRIKSAKAPVGRAPLPFAIVDVALASVEFSDGYSKMLSSLPRNYEMKDLKSLTSLEGKLLDYVEMKLASILKAFNYDFF